MIENNAWKSILKKQAIEIKKFTIDDNPSAFPLLDFSIYPVL